MAPPARERNEKLNNTMREVACDKRRVDTLTQSTPRGGRKMKKKIDNEKKSER
jgi:hypothetical protein